MTAKQISAIQASWLKLKTIPLELGELLYQELFAVNPALDFFFTGSIKTKGNKLIKAPDGTISSLDILQGRPLKRMPLPYLAPFSNYDGLALTSFTNARKSASYTSQIP